MKLEVTEIMEILPHRYPMLLVDRMLELEPMKRAVGIKNVTMNDPYFQGHFPGNPIMPGVLLCEAMASRRRSFVISGRASRHDADVHRDG